MLTRKIVAQQLRDYLNHHITLAQLVDWAEAAMIDANLEDGYEKVIMQSLGTLGVADVKEFGLRWEECEAVMRPLGFILKVEVERAA